MIPLRDLNPSRTRPYVTILLILANAAVFAYQLTLPVRQLNQFVLAYALQPYELTHGLPMSATVAVPAAASILTSMFMHGGWLHIIGNMLYLWIFGNNIEDRLGHVVYLVLYLGWGVAAALTQVMIDPGSQTPMLGASGAVAGVLGAYLVLYPQARVDTLVTLGIFISTVRMPALVVIGFWIVIQFFNGFLSLGAESDGVAYFAHIGGALGGLLVGVLVRMLGDRGQPSSPYDGYGGRL